MLLLHGSHICYHLFFRTANIVPAAEKTIQYQKPLIRLVIAGNDQLLFTVLCALQSVRRAASDEACVFRQLYRAAQFRFLLVPFGPCSLASYIARHDSWYKYVSVVFFLLLLRCC